jgi:hypothetical protein
MMNPPRSYALIAACATLLASGVICHLLAKDSAALDDAAARVARVPTTIGDWQGHEEPTDEPSFVQAGAKGYWMRCYVHRKTKASVLVILMCGRPGKMSVHTPDVCYRGAGYELYDQPTECLKNDAGEAPFWTAKFTKKAPVPMHLRLYWGWNARGKWEAAPAPRWQFRGEAFLYKLYVSRDISQQPNLAPQVDVTAEFLRRFVPEMNKTLFD